MSTFWGTDQGCTYNGNIRVSIDFFAEAFKELSRLEMPDNIVDTMDDKTRLFVVERWLRDSGAQFAWSQLNKKDKGILRGLQSSVHIIAEFSVLPEEFKKVLLAEAKKRGADIRSDEERERDKLEKKERRQREHENTVEEIERNFGEKIIDVLREKGILTKHQSYGVDNKRTRLEILVTDNENSGKRAFIERNLKTGDYRSDSSYEGTSGGNGAPDWLDLNSFREPERVELDKLIKYIKENIIALRKMGDEIYFRVASEELRNVTAEWLEIFEPPFKMRIDDSFDLSANKVKEYLKISRELEEKLMPAMEEAKREKSELDRKKEEEREKREKIENTPRTLITLAIDRWGWISKTKIKIKSGINNNTANIKYNFEYIDHGGKTYDDYSYRDDHTRNIERQLGEIFGIEHREIDYNWNPPKKETEILLIEVHCYSSSSAEYRQLTKELGNNWSRSSLVADESGELLGSNNSPKPEPEKDPKQAERREGGVVYSGSDYTADTTLEKSSPVEILSDEEKGGLLRELSEQEELLELLQGYKISDDVGGKKKKMMEEAIKRAKNVKDKFGRIKKKLSGEESANANDKKEVEKITVNIKGASEVLAKAFGEKEDKIKLFSRALERAEINEYYDVIIEEQKRDLYQKLFQGIKEGRISSENLEINLEEIFESY